MKDCHPYAFKNRERFRQWLEQHHTQDEAIWMAYGKTSGCCGSA